MKSRIRIAALTLVLGMLIVSAADAQPRWQLKVKPMEPGVVALFDVLNQGTNYWYFPFEVKNTTDKPLDVLLTVKAFTDTNKSYVNGFYPEALKKVQRVVGVRLRSMRDMRGTIKAGETWTGVAIFKRVDPVMDRITFRILGLEDVLVTIKGVTYVEIRGLDVTYKQIGDEYFPWEDPIEYVSKKWKVLKQRTRVPRR